MLPEPFSILTCRGTRLNVSVMSPEPSLPVTSVAARPVTSMLPEPLLSFTRLPASPDVHETARAVNAGTRVVYVDRDPVVLAHARALLAVDDEVGVVAGDIGDPWFLADPALTDVIDGHIQMMFISVGSAVFNLAMEPALQEFVPHQTGAPRRAISVAHYTKILRPTKWLQSFVYAGYQRC